jgi:hypothetical protein
MERTARLLRGACAILVVSVSVLVSPQVRAQTTYAHGYITDVTATTGGILLRINNPRPEVCNGTPHLWMEVHKDDKALMSMALIMWTTGRKGGVFYVNPPTSGGYCRISQIDPYEQD